MSTPQATDPVKFKAAVREQWDKSAPGWHAHAPQLRAWLSSATETMLKLAGVAAGSRVLDVAAGAGDQTLDIAQRVGPAGSVLATDLSPAILLLAKNNATQAGYNNIDIRVADGESLPVQSGHFDVAVCRLGLMFFPNPLLGLQEMHRALRPGGGLCTMVFSGPSNNPCVAILMSTALRHAGLPPRDPWQPGGLLSLGKPGLLEALFESAGFRDVTTVTVDAPFRMPSVRHYLDFVRTSASPVQQILAGLAPAAADAAWADIEERLGEFTTASGWEGPNELLLTAARR